MSDGGDEFESTSNTTDTPSNTSAGEKHFQVTVPNFTELNGVASVGTSFIRLGSSPTPSQVTMQSATFKNSVDLAKLVGDKTNIQATEKLQKKDAMAREDANFLLGFCDDTRSKNKAEVDANESLSNGDTPSTSDLSNVAYTARKARQDETVKLLTKGGWWDHSDGNRITTTKGDKIEVIQGNYKMVVLGRQDPATDPATLVQNALITDVSGGQFQEQTPTPTPCLKTIEWNLERDGSWSVFQDNGKGNITTRFDGNQKDYYTGTTKETYVGEDPGDIKLELVKLPTKDKDPEIISKTWAKKIESYTGSFNKPVPHIFSLTFADAIESITNAASIVNVTNAASIANLNNAFNNFDFTLGIKESIQIGLALNLFLGGKLDLFPTPWVTFSLDTAGFHNLKTEATNAENRLRNIENDITNISNDIVSVDNRLSGQSTHLSNEVTRLSNQDLRLAQTTLRIARAVHDIALEMNLGY